MVSGIGRAGADGREALAQARMLVGRGAGLVVLTGAGISTDSGIPDFRGPRGLWRTEPGSERRSRIEDYVRDQAVRRSAWRNRAAAPVFSAEPNEAHRALVVLEQQGLLSGIVTQNVDGLHQAAGSDPARVIELHGNVHRTRCLCCGAEQPTVQVLARVRSGDEDPRCEAPGPGQAGRCGGILQTATVSFGQPLEPTVWSRACALVRGARVLIAAGSTLSVRPACGLVPMARDGGASVVVVNDSPTAMDDLADVVVRGRLAEVLPVVLGL